MLWWKETVFGPRHPPMFPHPLGRSLHRRRKSVVLSGTAKNYTRQYQDSTTHALPHCCANALGNKRNKMRYPLVDNNESTRPTRKRKRSQPQHLGRREDNGGEGSGKLARPSKNDPTPTAVNSKNHTQNWDRARSSSRREVPTKTTGSSNRRQPPQERYNARHALRVHTKFLLATEFLAPPPATLRCRW